MGKNVAADSDQSSIVMGNVAPLHMKILILEQENRLYRSAFSAEGRRARRLENELALSRSLNDMLRKKVKGFKKELEELKIKYRDVKIDYEDSVRTLFWGPND